ncbi:MAG: hypothetical protein KBS43_06500 [Oscillospiraceae bacterium]|nr:hypothetical protein [Candidatus Limimonas coprohippi]MCQ2488445.1 hypothetical protein [Clostridia bacterium]
MLTTLGIGIIGLIAIILMLLCVVFAAIAIIVLYTGRAAQYDRAGKKMAKASKPKKAKK